MTASAHFGRIAADSGCGVGDTEMVLCRAGKSYVLGVSANHHFGSWIGKPLVAGTAEVLAGTLDPALGKQLSTGAGIKGERLTDNPRYLDHSCCHRFAAACDAADGSAQVSDVFM